MDAIKVPPIGQRPVVDIRSVELGGSLAQSVGHRDEEVVKIVFLPSAHLVVPKSFHEERDVVPRETNNTIFCPMTALFDAVEDHAPRNSYHVLGGRGGVATVAARDGSVGVGATTVGVVGWVVAEEGAVMHGARNGWDATKTAVVNRAATMITVAVRAELNALVPVQASFWVGEGSRVGTVVDGVGREDVSQHLNDKRFVGGEQEVLV